MEKSLKNGTCPKCNSQEVYSTTVDSHKLLPHNLKGTLLDFRQAATADNFVCGNCGYAEFYVRPIDLETVKENWELRKPQ